MLIHGKPLLSVPPPMEFRTPPKEEEEYLEEEEVEAYDDDDESSFDDDEDRSCESWVTMTVTEKADAETQTDWVAEVADAEVAPLRM